MISIRAFARFCFVVGWFCESRTACSTADGSRIVVRDDKKRCRTTKTPGSLPTSPPGLRGISRGVAQHPFSERRGYNWILVIPNGDGRVEIRGTLRTHAYIHSIDTKICTFGAKMGRLLYFWVDLVGTCVDSDNMLLYQ